MGEAVKIHPVLESHLLRWPTAPEAEIVRSWARLDSVDAARFASTVLRRLRLRDPVQITHPNDPPIVLALVADWSGRLGQIERISAATRLAKAMTLWADTELSDLMNTKTVH